MSVQVAPISNSLSGLLKEKGALTTVLSFLDVCDQIRCRSLCKTDNQTITIKVLGIAIRNLVERHPFSLSELQSFKDTIERINTPLNDSVCHLVLNDKDDIIASFKKFPRLQRLTLTLLEKDVLSEISQTLPHLTHLFITLEAPMDDFWRKIGNFKNLTNLKVQFDFNQIFQLIQFEKLSRLERLETFEFNGVKREQTKIAPLALLRQLRHLILPTCHITDLFKISAFCSMRSVEFFVDNQITEEHFDQIAENPNLRSIHIHVEQTELPPEIQNKIAQVPHVTIEACGGKILCKGGKILRDKAPDQRNDPCHKRIMRALLQKIGF